jgi:hypothetical protein
MKLTAKPTPPKTAAKKTGPSKQTNATPASLNKKAPVKQAAKPIQKAKAAQKLANVVVNSYGNFFQNQFVTIAHGDPIPFNKSGRRAGGVFLQNPTTIRVNRGGDYFISYVVTVTTRTSQTLPFAPAVAVFINGNIVSNAQTSSGIQIGDANDTNDCRQIHGEAIVFIPAGARVQLRNSSFFEGTIEFCDNGIQGAAINLIKVSR